MPMSMGCPTVARSWRREGADCSLSAVVVSEDPEVVVVCPGPSVVGVVAPVVVVDDDTVVVAEDVGLEDCGVVVGGVVAGGVVVTVVGLPGDGGPEPM